MNQQKNTFDCLFPHLSDNGIYICEDLCTSYWPSFGGSLKDPNTYVEKMKDLVDDLNADAINAKESQSLVSRDKYYRNNIKSINFFVGLVVIEKGHVPRNFAEERGPGI